MWALIFLVSIGLILHFLPGWFLLVAGIGFLVWLTKKDESKGPSPKSKTEERDKKWRELVGDDEEID